MNYKFTINKQRRVCDLILAVVLLCVYFLLGAIKVSPPKYVLKNEYREIDWTLFHLKEKSTVLHKDNFSEYDLNENITNGVDNVVIPNLDFIKEETQSLWNVNKKRYDALKFSDGNESSNSQLHVSNDLPVNQLPDLTYKNRKFNLYDNWRPNMQPLEGPSIQIEESPQTDINIYGTRQQNFNRFKTFPDDKAIPESDVVKITMRKQDVNEEEKDLSPLINELIIWMKNNPTTFSDVFKRFMDYEEGNLTAKVKFKISEKIYELFILCKENILEVRICLIEERNSILLIDSGFKERSNYLREGGVNRSEDGSISSFFTQQKTPSEESTKEFYKIFLSWWETTKKRK